MENNILQRINEAEGLFASYEITGKELARVRQLKDKLENLIEELNKNKKVHGILVQSPIPKHLDVNRAFEKIAPEKDVDGFNPVNVFACITTFLVLVVILSGIAFLLIRKAIIKER